MKEVINIDENVFEKIAKANDEITPFIMTRKEKTKNGDWVEKEDEYCEVKERVIAFRKVFPLGCIRTEITQTENYIVANTTIKDDSLQTLATGYARELANKPFALENAETSAIGRALGFCGFGIKTSISTMEDMQEVDSPSGLFDVEEDKKRKEDAIAKFNKLNATQRANILNVVKGDLENVETELLESLVRNAK